MYVVAPRHGPTLRRAAWVGVRDLESAALALELGVPPERVDHQLDDAFLLAPQSPPAAARRTPCSAASTA